MKTYKCVWVLLLVLIGVGLLVSCEKKSTETQASTTAAQTVEVIVAVERELTIEEKLIEDQWCFQYYAEGHGEYGFFFRFYESDPVFGKIFYAGMSNNRINFAGIYELLEEPYEYSIYANREDALAKANEIDGVALYTVVFFDWDGNETGRVGFDGKVLYNAQDKDSAIIYTTGATPYAYVKNDGDFDALIAGEMPVAIWEFVADDEATSTIQINHNHTYIDLVEAMVEGSWSAEVVDGKLVLSCTAFDPTDHSAVIVLSSDGLRAIYTADGGEAIAMSVPQPEVTVSYVFEGKVPTAYGRDADLTLSAMSDGSFSIEASIFGNSMEIDRGVYTVVGGFKFSFESERTGTLNSRIVESLIHLPYAQEGTPLGNIEGELIIKR